MRLCCICRYVAQQAKLLNESDDWKKALSLMRRIAMKQLGLTKEEASTIGVHIPSACMHPTLACLP